MQVFAVDSGTSPIQTVDLEETPTLNRVHYQNIDVIELFFSGK